jgi:hypothetical protein
LENCGYTNLTLFKAQLLQDVPEFEAFTIAMSDTLLNDYDRFLIVLDAAQWGIREANGIFNMCDFSVRPILYTRVQFNEPGKY